MDRRTKDDTLREFLAESDELLDTLRRHLDRIEQAPDSISPESLNALFRAAHTLKGMSGVMGLTAVADLAHSLEDVMDRLRMGKLGMSRGLVELLGDGVDALGQLIAAASSGEVPPDTSALVRRLRDAMNDVQAAEPPVARSGVDPEILQVLTEYEQHRLQENIKAKHRLFEVRVRFRFEDFDKALSSLTAKLQNIGEVITTLPSSGVSPEAGIAFTLLVGSSHDRDALTQLLAGDGAEIVLLGGDEGAQPKVAPASESESPSTRSLSQTIRVDIAKLDALLNMLGELVLSKSVIVQIARDLLQSGGLVGPAMELHKAAQALEHRVSGLQEGLIEIRMIPVAQLFDRSIRAIKKISRDLGKEIQVTTSGEETKLDKSMVEAIADPLLHLIRNALDHGIEPTDDRRRLGKPDVGTIHLSAAQKGHTVTITVADDGAGINLAKVRELAIARSIAVTDKEYTNKEIIDFLFQPGFSTAESVTEISGRGVGLDVVARHIAKLNGIVEVNTELGQGTSFVLTLPITLVIIKALIVGVGTQTYAIPISSVSESVMIDPKQVVTIGGRPVIHLRDHTLSLLRLSDLFGVAPAHNGDGRLYIIVVGLAEKRLGLVVDTISGQQEIVIKSIGSLLQGIPGIAGATELGNRKTILVLDVGALIDEAVCRRSTVLPLAA
ncbi:MAG: chemotaxis protein CheA [Nitrospirota bacterium]